MNSYLPNHERGSTMSDRIDHAAEAVALLNLAAATQHQGDPRHLIAASQVHATLALVEQQRIANLVALTKNTFAAHEAREALSTFATAKLGEQIGLRPDIAAALGIEAVDHG